ncbi:MAG: hypothetical protein PVF74_04490 [Anaerolineales bacterium]|jgi:hypothetical protein
MNIMAWIFPFGKVGVVILLVVGVMTGGAELVMGWLLREVMSEY